MIAHRQGVAQLNAEEQVAISSCLLHVTDQADRPVVLQVVVEHLVGDVDIAVAELVVQDVQHLVLAEQGRIELDDRVQAAFLDQVAGDLFDLIRRAAVHR